MKFDEVIQERYSVRRYADRPVEPQKLDAVLEEGRIAPTGGNNQPVHVYALQSMESLQKVRSLTRCAFDAPVVLLVTYDTDVEWKNPLNPTVSSGQQDASIAGTYMMLKATDLGLSTCWVNYFDVQKCHDAFDLPEKRDAAVHDALGIRGGGCQAQPPACEAQSHGAVCEGAVSLRAGVALPTSRATERTGSAGPWARP